MTTNLTLKSLGKRTLLAALTAAAVVAGAAAFSAFEAHVINVSARIENALSVDTTPIDFGTVFPQEQMNRTFGVRLSDSFLSEGRVDDIEYEIRQKPKCILTSTSTQVSLSPFGRAVEDGQGNFLCEDEANYEMLPLLCPYLSKHEITDDGKETDNDKGIDAFHGVISGWNMATTLATRAFGRLAKSAQDLTDTWNVDLKVPCFGGFCAQDWEAYVHNINASATPASFVQPIANEHKLFGCDLWLEVNQVSEKGGLGCLKQADIMLVLDRSGSIGGDMPTLKNAANVFVDALQLDGVHAGMSSFASDATLDVHLTNNTSTLHTAINGLVSSGTTYLEGGIVTATNELANPGDGDDRPDGTSPDFMVIITDGVPNVCDTVANPSCDPAAAAKAAADAARAAGIEVFVVGVGSGVNQAYLETIADDASHYFSAANFASLQAILQGLASCNN